MESEDLKHHNTKALLSGILIMAFFQLIHFIIMIATTIKLAKQLVHRTVCRRSTRFTTTVFLERALMG